MNKNKNISIIGVPMDLGQSRRGVDMGPSAVRYAGMLNCLSEIGYKVEDLGDLTVDHTLDESGGQLKNLDEIVRVSNELAIKADEVVKKGHFPLIVGGDHSIAIGSLAGISRHYENLGVIWYDAHGDLNTPESSPSGNIHGMPLAASLGIGEGKLVNLYDNGPKIKPENLVIIGARSLDPGEKELIWKQGIRVYTMHEVDRMGMPGVIDDALAYLKGKTDGLHLSLDLDGLDPTEAPGVGTPVIGGLTYRESHLAMEMIYESGLLTSAEFVEVNPILDDGNRTADLAVGLMGSLFGEKLK